MLYTYQNTLHASNELCDRQLGGGTAIQVYTWPQALVLIRNRDVATLCGCLESSHPAVAAAFAEWERRAERPMILVGKH